MSVPCRPGRQTQNHGHYALTLVCEAFWKTKFEDTRISNASYNTGLQNVAKTKAYDMYGRKPTGSII